MDSGRVRSVAARIAANSPPPMRLPIRIASASIVTLSVAAAAASAVVRWPLAA